MIVEEKTDNSIQNKDEAIKKFKDEFLNIQNEISKFIVGQEEIIEKVLIAIICGGHVLLEGVPGLGKTALVNTISKVLHMKFKRIQFTPDLLPADILGTNILVDKDGGKVFEFQEGPVFTNILLADEINRSTPKTQSALLETMQEKTVTIAGKTHKLELPYFVLATQNPLEMDGTYSLPEAQMDRFYFKLNVKLPKHEDFSLILDRTTGSAETILDAVSNGPQILELGELAKTVPIEPSVKADLIRLVMGTHPGNENATQEVERFIRYGASPRAAQAILGASRVKALLEGRFHVCHDDIRSVASAALRHRIILSFEGDAEGIDCDDLVEDLMNKIFK